MNRLLLTTLLILLVSCSPKSETSSVRFTHRFFRMNTVTDVLIFGGDSLSEAKVNKVFERIDSLLYSWEKRFSVGIEDSEVYLINNRVTDTLTVSADLFYMVHKAEQYQDTLSGLFDITLLPLKEFWKPQSSECKFPDPMDSNSIVQLDLLKELHSRDTFELIFPDKIVFFDSVTTIDLGGIAKGKVIELLGQLLAEEDITDYLISSGGDIVGCGRKGDNTLYRVGVQDPRNDTIAALFTLENRAVVTSGDYERFRIAASGKRVHHLFDPRTFSPSTQNQSVTVLAKSPVEADILSTGLFPMKADEIITFINDRPELAALVIDRNGHKWFSKSFEQLE